MAISNWDDEDNMGIYLLQGDIIEQEELQDIRLRYYGVTPTNPIDLEDFNYEQNKDNNYFIQ